jgi:hypothetical protein
VADPTPAPSFVAAVAALPEAERAKTLARVHPDYTTWTRTWKILLDAYDGTGGFLTGSYIWRFPRELQEKYEQRAEQARYHNFVETLVDLYVRYVFSQKVVRSAEDDGLTAWWADVDGRGTDIESFLRGALAEALASGHSGILMDKAQAVPLGPAKADDPTGEPYLVRYAPLDIRDWQVTRDLLEAVKLVEPIAPDMLEAESDSDLDLQYLIWDATGWARYDEKGAFLVGANVTLGAPPLVLLRPKPSHRYRWIGKPLINANVVLALFNRGSEEDVVLRDQAFSLFVVEVPATADPSAVEAVKAQIGGDVGTTSAMVVQGTAKYETPSTEVPPMIRESAAACVRELYRAAHLRFEKDGLQKETAEAIRLANAELNQMLNGLASELTRVELALARLYFGWTTNDQAAAARAFEAADVSITYPREFFTQDLLVELQTWAEALKFGLGDTFEKRLKKRVLAKLEPDLDQATKDTIEAEIDAAPTRDERAAQMQTEAGAMQPDALRQRAAARLQQFGADRDGTPPETKATV